MHVLGLGDLNQPRRCYTRAARRGSCGRGNVCRGERCPPWTRPAPEGLDADRHGLALARLRCCDSQSVRVAQKLRAAAAAVRGMRNWTCYPTAIDNQSRHGSQPEGVTNAGFGHWQGDAAQTDRLFFLTVEWAGRLPLRRVCAYRPGERAMWKASSVAPSTHSFQSADPGGWRPVRLYV